MKKLHIIFLLTCLIMSPVAFTQTLKGDINKDGVIKILAIANSFSEDALDNYLTELAIAADKKLVIGDLYIGGAPLDLHLKNIKEDAQTYRYTKIDEKAQKNVRKEISIAQAIADDDWDYISFQQVSSLSGKYEAIQASLPEFVDLVRKLASPETAFIYHQTWAYQHDSTHEGFKNYSSDQMTMYKAIRDVTKKIASSDTFLFIVPAGTAIQNARTSSIGDTYTRDGYHLHLDYGRFTAACTWYEKVFGDDVRKNPYIPEKVTKKQAKIAKEAAHKAVKKPFKVSKVKL